MRGHLDSEVRTEGIADAVSHVNSTVTKVVYRHQLAGETTTSRMPYSASRAPSEGPIRRA
ncbi:MAG TPA: hypothetical protein VN969_12315 [Streptosporangiaceae bacterium]|nr:hypothetical protein [Streptosporangiaceae bacterium]